MIRIPYATSYHPYSGILIYIISNLYAVMHCPGSVCSVFCIIRIPFVTLHHSHKFESQSGRGIQHYVIKFVSDLRQVGGVLRQ